MNRKQLWLTIALLGAIVSLPNLAKGESVRYYLTFPASGTYTVTETGKSVSFSGTVQIAVTNDTSNVEEMPELDAAQTYASPTIISVRGLGQFEAANQTWIRSTGTSPSSAEVSLQPASLPVALT